MRKIRAFPVEPDNFGRISDQESAQFQALARRGMQSNTDHVEMIRAQILAHRIAAAASILPRVRIHLSALADHLEMGLDADQGAPQPKANDPGAD